MVLRITGGSAGDEAHHDDGPGVAAEDHQEQRIHQHDRRRGQRRDPGLGRPAQQVDAIAAARRGHADHGDHHAGGEGLEDGQAKALADVLLDDDAPEGERDFRGQRHDEAVDRRRCGSAPRRRGWR